MTKSIEIRLADVIVAELGVDEGRTGLDAKFSALGADSLDMVSLALMVENEFHIEIPDDKLEEWVTVRDALRYVEEILRTGQRSGETVQ